MDFVGEMIHKIKFLLKCNFFKQIVLMNQNQFNGSVQVIYKVKFSLMGNFLKQIVLMNHCLQIYIFLNL